MLKAYFDESGTHAEAEATVIAGYVGGAASWESVETQWRNVLQEYGINTFHMTELRAQQGEFELMDTPIRNGLLTALSGILRNADLSAVWCGIDAQVWMRATTNEFREHYSKPYDFCFNSIVRQLITLTSSEDRVGLVFADQPEYEDSSEQTLSEWRKYTNIGPLAFDRPKYLPALQTADMLVNEMYRSWSDFAGGRASPGKVPISNLLKRITKNDLGKGGFLDERGLKLWVANDNWRDPYFPCPAGGP